MLIERVEQGVPLEVLDLRTCFAADRAIQLLKEIVVEVQEPLAAGTMAMEEPAFFNWNGGIGYCNEVEYDDGWGPWYGCYYGTWRGRRRNMIMSWPVIMMGSTLMGQATRVGLATMRSTLMYSTDVSKLL